MGEHEQSLTTTHDPEEWRDAMSCWSLERLSSMQSFAEIKVAAILGAGAILLAPLVDRLPKLVGLACVGGLDPRRTCVALALLVYAGSQIGVFLSALLVLWPRLRSSRQSLLYFGDLAGMTYEQFREAYTGATRAELREHAISQIHDNARITRAKFLWVRWCIGSLTASLVPWVVLLALS